MNIKLSGCGRSALLAVSLGTLLLMPVSSAFAQPGTMDEEINFLISKVGRDGCVFIRNDRRYTGRQARVHLQSKLELNAALVHNTEEFIDKIASISADTGKPYLIRCARQYQFSAYEWFTMLLASYRKEQP